VIEYSYPNALPLNYYRDTYIHILTPSSLPLPQTLNLKPQPSKPDCEDTRTTGHASATGDLKSMDVNIARSEEALWGLGRQVATQGLYKILSDRARAPVREHLNLETQMASCPAVSTSSWVVSCSFHLLNNEVIDSPSTWTGYFHEHPRLGCKTPSGCAMV